MNIINFLWVYSLFTNMYIKKYLWHKIERKKWNSAFCITSTLCMCRPHIVPRIRKIPQPKMFSESYMAQLPNLKCPSPSLKPKQRPYPFPHRTKWKSLITTSSHSGCPLMLYLYLNLRDFIVLHLLPLLQRRSTPWRPIQTWNQPSPYPKAKAKLKIQLLLPILRRL